MGFFGGNNLGVLPGKWRRNIPESSDLQFDVFFPRTQYWRTLNGDGKPDLIVSEGYLGASSPKDAMSILLGNGDGDVFGMRRRSQLEKRVGTVVAADVNGDGRADLVLTEYKKSLS